MTSRSTGSDTSLSSSRSTGIVSILQFGRSILGRPNQSLTTPTKQVGDTLANVGETQPQATLSFARIAGIGPLLRMLLHLTPRKLVVHAHRHVHDEIAVFLAGDVMALSALIGPVLEPPEGARRLAGALGAPFRPCAGHGSL